MTTEHVGLALDDTAVRMLLGTLLQFKQQKRLCHSLNYQPLNAKLSLRNK